MATLAPNTCVPAVVLGEGVAPSGPITASVRPQAMRFSQSQPTNSDVIRLEGTVAQSAFLGETWDYVFKNGKDGSEYKVVAPPADVFPVGAPIWLQIDPRQIVPIAD